MYAWCSECRDRKVVHVCVAMQSHSQAVPQYGFVSGVWFTWRRVYHAWEMSTVLQLSTFIC